MNNQRKKRNERRIDESEKGAELNFFPCPTGHD